MNKHIEEETEAFGLTMQRICPKNTDFDLLKAHFYQALTSIYQRGREDLQKEIAHEQRKLLDGFAHPKDCPQCSPLPEYPRE